MYRLYEKIQEYAAKNPPPPGSRMSWWGALIGLARAVEQNSPHRGNRRTDDGRPVCHPSPTSISMTTRSGTGSGGSMRRKMRWPRTVPCARIPVATTGITIWKKLWTDNEDIRSLKSLILFGLKGMAAIRMARESAGLH